MTQFIEPNKKSDLTAPRVLDWLQSLRSGLLNGFTVTVATGFNVNIASGRAVIRGTTIHDDATRLNQSGLITAPGANNEHTSIYVQYSYLDTFPPAAMVIGAVKTIAGAIPPAKPAIPAIPADAVKIADVLVPGAAVDLSTATIINAPPLLLAGSSDGDVLVERLIHGNANMLITGGGSFAYNGSTTLTWSDDIDITSPCITHRELFGSASLYYGRIPSGSLGPSPVVGPNSLLFAVADRRTPRVYSSPETLSLHVINLDAPAAAELTYFFDPLTRDKIIVIGKIDGGNLALSGNMGVLPAPTSEPPPRFLGMDPGGVHTWESVDDTDLVGGLQVLPWTFVNPTLMTAAAAAAAAIPAAQRKTGMLVRARESASGYVEDLVYDGASFAPLTRAGDGVNWGVITGCAVTNVSGAIVRVAPGQFRCHDGRVVTVYENVDVTVTTSQNVVWDRTDATIKVLTKGTALFEDFVFAYGQLSVGSFKQFTPCAPRVLRTVPRTDVVYFGNDAGNNHGTHFDTLYHALVWRAAHGDAVGSFKSFFLAKNAGYALDLVSLPGTVTATSGAGATVTGTGTRFLRDFAAGDWIKIGSRHAKVSVVASDTSMTVVTMAAVVGSATAYSRIAWIGTHAWVADAGFTEIGAMTNIEIFGEMTPEDPGNCAIGWGTQLSGDVINECRAVISGGAGGTSHNWLVRDIALRYDGEATDLANHANVAVDYVGKNWRFNNVYIDGRDTLSHAVRVDADVGVLVMDNVEIVDLKDATAVYGSAAASGRLTMSRGDISCPTSGKLNAVFEFVNGNTVSVLADDCQFDHVKEAVFIQDTAGDWNEFPRTLRHCRLGWYTGGAARIAIRSTGDLSDAARVTVDDCLFANGAGLTVTLTGATQVLASRSISSTPGTVVDNAASRHASSELKDIVNDFATLTGVNFKSGLGNIAHTRGHVQMINGLAGQSTQGYANRGVECHPAHLSGVKFISSPNPGYVRAVTFPDGRQASATGAFSIPITSGTDRATGAVAVDDTIYYAFLRKDVGGIVVDGLAYSSRAPQDNGSLNAADTLEGGRAVSDYLFIGSVMTGVVSSGAPWGTCRAVHYGNGLRRVWASRSAGIHADLQDSLTTIDGGGLSGTLSLPNLNARLPTAREFELQRELTLKNTGGGTVAGAFISLTAPAGDRTAIFCAQVAMTEIIQLNDLVTIPRMNHATVNDYRCSWTGSGSLYPVSASVKMSVRSWLENLNFITPLDPPGHDG